MYAETNTGLVRLRTAANRNTATYCSQPDDGGDATARVDNVYDLW